MRKSFDERLKEYEGLARYCGVKLPEENRGMDVKKHKRELLEVYDAWSDNLITAEDYFAECFRLCSENIGEIEK